MSGVLMVPATLSRALPTIAAAALTLAAIGCAFPRITIHTLPTELNLIPGQSGSITVETGPPSCDPEDPLPCPDVTDRVFDFVLQHVPAGVTFSIDRTLQSPDTPGLVRITFNVAPDASPVADAIAVHAVMDGRILGSLALPFRIIRVSSAATAAPVAVSASSMYSLALLADGTVLSWGDNAAGQLGLGTYTRAVLPTPIPNLTGVVAVSAGREHALALTGDGQVWAWGRNGRGQLGRTPLNHAETVNTPMLVPGVQNIQAVAAGDSHSLALDRDGVVWTWGNFSSPDSIVDDPPIPLRDMPPMRGIAAGAYKSFGVDVNGAVWSWLHVRSGRRLFFLQVAGLSDIDMVVSEDGTQLAVDRSGDVWAWGLNSSWLLADDTLGERRQPARIQGLANIASIGIGRGIATAVTRTGALWRWGDDLFQREPVQVPLPNVRLAETGSGHLLAILECGAVWGAGRNTNGEVGDGTTSPVDDPVPIWAIGDDSACPTVALRVVLTGDSARVGFPPTVQPGTLLETFPEMIGFFAPGTTVTVTANPLLETTGPFGRQRFELDSWRLDCSGADAATTVVLTRSKRCAVVYRETTVTPLLLTVLSDGGTVTSDRSGAGGTGPIACPPTCNAIYQPDTVVRLRAHNTGGFAFTHWSGNCAGTDANVDVTMTAARTCRAHFRPFTLDVSVTGSGVVQLEELGAECAGACSFTPRRLLVSLRALPSLGWRLDGWSGDCSGDGAFATIDMDGDLSCTASFSRTPGFFFLTMIVEGLGSVTSQPPGIECSGNCVVLLPAGSTFDITAHDTSRSILSVWLDDCLANAVPTINLVLDRDKTCRVRFVDRPGFPIAQMTWAPATARVGQVITFDGNGSYVFDPATNNRDHAGIRHWSWDFNADGSVDAAGGRNAAAIAQYAFQSPGTQQVALVVTGGPFDETDDHVDNPFITEATQPLFDLSVNKAGSGRGEIATVWPGIIRCPLPCTSAGPVVLESGTAVTLRATPESGSIFNGWSGAGCSGANELIDVTMSAARSCTATFTVAPVTFTLSVAINAPVGSVASVIAVAPPENTIFCRAGIGGPGCSQAFAPGTVVQVRPSDSVIENGKFGGWSGCDAVGALATCNVSLTNDRTVTLTVLP